MESCPYLQHVKVVSSTAPLLRRVVLCRGKKKEHCCVCVCVFFFFFFFLKPSFSAPALRLVEAGPGIQVFAGNTPGSTSHGEPKQTWPFPHATESGSVPYQIPL